MITKKILLVVEVWRTWAATPFGKQQLPIVPGVLQYPLKMCYSAYMQDGLLQISKSTN